MAADTPAIISTFQTTNVEENEEKEENMPRSPMDHVHFEQNLVTWPLPTYLLLVHEKYTTKFQWPITKHLPSHNCRLARIQLIQAVLGQAHLSQAGGLS